VTTIITQAIQARQFVPMITMTQKQGLRKKLLDACICKQQFLIDNLIDRIRALMEGPILSYVESYDSPELDSGELKLKEANRLNAELASANLEMYLLENLRMTEDLNRDRPSPGAIVVTDHHTFFVSASLEKFFAGGHGYVGVSTRSPIYLAMKGKKKGEHFTFKDVDYKIKDIF
jgi:hypothetical protein